MYPFNRLNRSLPTMGALLAMTRSFPPLPVLGQSFMNLLETFEALLVESIRQRVATIPFSGGDKPRIAILFSGGLDCTALAFLVDRVLPVGEGIDLINVAFENPRKLQFERSVAGGANPNPNQKNKKMKETKKERQERIKREQERVSESAGAVEETMLKKEGEGEDEVYEPKEQESIYDVPDRLTGRSSWQDLCQLKPDRSWNFVEVDVPYEEMTQHRQRVIELMKPQDTVMDLSIAIAFYFAARGRGFLARPEGEINDNEDKSCRAPYESTARVLLSGLGADELLGGYARHRKAYNLYQPPIVPPNDDDEGTFVPPPLPDSPQGHVKWTSLINELELDLNRLSSRNLGRDDRIISSMSKEVRYPFLASPVVAFLTDLPVWHKCDMRFEEGMGDKLLLRMLVRKFGLERVWRYKKRAIHFGARTAKMEQDTGRAKGTDRL
ncbi:putative asparagine synthase [Sporobolomyces koalae]|uniref:putative asparagine synthase n=1 Tax=Sporobolomyces koalae TaxID=500713 RepID=UPI0031791ADB